MNNSIQNWRPLQCVLRVSACGGKCILESGPANRQDWYPIDSNPDVFNAFFSWLVHILIGFYSKDDNNEMGTVQFGDNILFRILILFFDRTSA